MGRIQSQFGLVTGTDILGTVDQLIAISAQPRDRLSAKNQQIVGTQTALTELTASVIAVQLSARRLGQSSLFSSRSTTVSSPEALSANAGANAAGSYTVETIQSAATHRVQSAQSYSSASQSLGLSGTLNISPTGNIDQQASLSAIADGRGVEDGSFRITDRSGKTAIVEIENATSIDDILDSINQADVGVRASTSNGAIRLVDTTGATDSNLIVEAVGDSETAADLGIWNVDVASSDYTGDRLIDATTSSTPLSQLGDIRFGSGTDLAVTLSDGREIEIDFGDFSIEATDGNPGQDAIGNPTIDDVIQFINDQHGSDLLAEFTGGKLVINDLAGGTDPLVIDDGDGSTVAIGLGIDQSDASGVVTSRLTDPLLKGVNLSQLGGGAGIAGLGDLDITLSDGSSVSVDLSTATSTTDIIETIAAASEDLIVTLNDSQTGFRLRDVSGGSGSFSIDAGDGTAEKLGLDTSALGDVIVGRDLQVATVSRGTTLADYFGNSSDVTGSFTITDSNGQTTAVNLVTDNVDTIGDLIDEINERSVDVTAQINANGDGISLVDTGGGSETLSVEDTGTGTAAARLGLTATASSQLVDGNEALVGSDALRIDVSSTDTLSSIAEKINASGRYVSASVVSGDDGRFRIEITSTSGGEAGQFSIDGTDLGFESRTVSRGQDALISVSIEGSDSQIYRSADGVFEIGADVSSDSGFSAASSLTSLNPAATEGSFTITDSNGSKSAINLTVENITTVGELVDRINSLGLGVRASVDATNGIAIEDTADGNDTLTIEDVGGKAASLLGISGEASSVTIDGVESTGFVTSGSSSSGSQAALTLTLKQLSDEPIRIDVDENTGQVLDIADTFVDQYNALIDKVEEFSRFDADTESVGLLFGSSETLRLRLTFSREISGSVSGAGEFRSAGQIGLRFDADGKLNLDRDKLRDAIADNPDAVEAFLLTEDTGLSDRVADLADRFAGSEDGALLRRRETLQTQLDRNDSRIEDLNGRLERERERLLTQFFRTEQIIGQLQTQQSAISSIQSITLSDS